jgi:WhiB family redox-sensing transcriptional regulator
VTYDDIVTLVFSPQPWRKHATCLGLSPDMFYPEKFSGQSVANNAKRICASCPVREECLTDAINTVDYFGVRSGMTPKERKREATRRTCASRDAQMAS